MHCKALLLGSLTLVSGVLLSGCSPISAKPGSEDIRVLSEAQSTGCERLGTANSQVISKVGFLKRDDAPMRDEAAQLAKNEAVAMGGNAVSPLSEVEDGRMTFAILSCPE